MSLGNVQKMGYTIKQKIDICLMAEANPDMTQADLANWAKKKYHTLKPPSQTTILRILSKKEELISLKEHEFKLIRRRKPSNVLLREVLTEWISQSVWEYVPITTPVIQQAAGTLWKLLPVSLREGSGEFSHKWCTHFLGKMTRPGASAPNLTRPKVWNIRSEGPELRKFLGQYNLKDVFVLDEFFLYYALPLDRAYVLNDYVEGLRTDKGVTVLLTTNADGLEKLEPMMVGHYEKMECFEGNAVTKLTKKYEVNYKNDKSAKLTLVQLSEWLLTLDKRLAIANRDIVLVLDDSVSHRVVNIELDYIKLVFVHNPNLDLPEGIPNIVTSRQPVLPMQTGVFREFKVLYRLQQYLLCKSIQQKQHEPLSADQYGISMTDVMIMVKNAWANVSVEVIRNAFLLADVVDLEEFTALEFSGSSSKIRSTPHRKLWGEGESHTHQTTSVTQNTATDFKNSEYKLEAAMQALTVHEPWDINTLTNLSFEDKFLRYSLPSDMVDACVVIENEPDARLSEAFRQTAKQASAKQNSTQVQVKSEQDLSDMPMSEDFMLPQVQGSMASQGMDVSRGGLQNIPEDTPMQQDGPLTLMSNNSSQKPLYEHTLFDDTPEAFFDFDAPDFQFSFGDEPVAPMLAPVYNQHVSKYSVNLLYLEPVKKGNLSSIITIPDNSRSFGVLYSKKRKVREDEPSLFSSPGNEAMSKATSVGSLSKHSLSVSSPLNTLTNPLEALRVENLNSSEKARLLEVVAELGRKGEVKLSDSCYLELMGAVHSLRGGSGDVGDLSRVLELDLEIGK